MSVGRRESKHGANITRQADLQSDPNGCHYPVYCGVQYGVYLNVWVV